MAERTKWPTGINPNGNGIRIRLFRGGAVIYSETVEGDPYSKSDLAAAVRRREQLKSRLALGLPLFEGDDAPAVQFSKAAQDYMDTLEADYSTSLGYENALNRYWLPEFGHWIISDISTKHIKNVLAKLRDISPKTKKNILIPLRGVMAHAMDDGTIKINPAAAVKLKKHQKPKVERFMPQERDAILGNLEGQAKVYFAVLFGCGLRPGEALGLQWPDYDTEQLYVHRQIVRRKIKSTTKTHESRRVHVPPWVRRILKNHTATRFSKKPEGWIFLNGLGKHYSDTDVFNDAWRKALAKSKVPYRIPYVCRHTRAAELLSSGVEPGKAAKQMGHTLEMFYRTYSEWIDEYSGSADKFRLDGQEPEGERAC
jgi:integrase